MKEQKLSQLVILLLILLIGNNIYAQSPVQVIQPSPQVSSLFKYVEYPVDFMTGLPQTSIPLYEVKSGNLSLPISLNYHSAGRKVYDETGAVGLGWTLMAGGTISRTVYGNADDNDAVAKFPVPWQTASQIDQHQPSGIDLLRSVNNEVYAVPWHDTEYDIFSYFVNGLSGKFALRDVNNVKIPVLLPKKPYVIQPHKYVGTSQNYFDYIDLTDDKGVLYHFSATEVSSTSMSNGSGASYTPITAWQLTKIVSADQSDSIVLKYTVFSGNQYFRYRPIQERDVMGTEISNCQIIYHSGFSDNEYTALDEFSFQRLTEIDFSSGKVVFNLQSGSDIVQSMQVFNNAGNTIKTVNFSLSYLDTRLDVVNAHQNQKLDSISIQGANNSNGTEGYKFDYFPTVISNIYGSTQAVSAYYCDLWGYYNASGNSDMRPVIPSSSDISFPNRGCSLSATESGVLKKITYPTGGSSEFIYELNQYMDLSTSTVKNSGGLRIAQINTFDGNNYSYKMYRYGTNECGYGFLPLVPTGLEYLNTSFNVTYGIGGAGAFIYVADYYTLSSYSSEMSDKFSYLSQKPIIYQQVTEYHGLGLNTIGKTVYTYDNDVLTDMTNPAYLQAQPGPSFFYNYCLTNSLIEKDDYKNSMPGSSNSTYQLVKTLTNTYTTTNYAAESLLGLYVQKFPINISPSYISANMISMPSDRYAALYPTYYCGDNGFNGAPTSLASPIGPLNIFNYRDYSLVVAKKELTSSTETLYTDAGNISSTTNYTYNSNHLLSNKTIVSSKGENISTAIKYPFDYSGNTTLNQMVGLNMLNYPVEQIETRNSSPVKSIRNNYFTWNTSPLKIYPKTIDAAIGANSYETRVQFNQYDNLGNILEQQKTGDVKEVYLWSYNGQYPVAQITGSDYNTVSGIVQQSQIDAATGIANNDVNVRNTLNTLRTSFASNPLVQVSTYTYAPLIGMTSKTDPSSRTNYFEYDGLNRLSLIRDQDQNILKKYDYQYQATTTATVVPAVNTPGSFTAAPGFATPVNGISSNGTTVSFYFVFYPTSAPMIAGNTYLVATISPSCWPSATRTFNVNIANRNWVITINPSGQMYWQLVAGSATLNVNNTIGTPTMTYNL